MNCSPLFTENCANWHALQAEVVKLRYFAGITNSEAAQALGLSERTVKNYWAYARAWLIREMQSDKSAGAQRMARPGGAEDVSRS